jgi:hypothetical protein
MSFSARKKGEPPKKIRPDEQLSVRAINIRTNIARFVSVLLLFAMMGVAGQPLSQRGTIDVVVSYPDPWELWYSGGGAFEPEPQDDFFFMSPDSAGVTVDPEEEPIPPKKKRKKRRKGGAGTPMIPGVSTMKRAGPKRAPVKAAGGGGARL